MNYWNKEEDVVKAANHMMVADSIVSCGRGYERPIYTSYVARNQRTDPCAGYSIEQLPEPREYVSWLAKSANFPQSIALWTEWVWRPMFSARLAKPYKEKGIHDLFIVDKRLALQLEEIDARIASAALKRGARMVMDVTLEHPFRLKIACGSWRVRYCDYRPPYEAGPTFRLQALAAIVQSQRNAGANNP